jgi:hypothetical protein
MGPKTTIMGRVWVTLFIGVLVMHAMGCNPEQRASFEGQRTAHSQNIFNPLGRFVSAMREQPMVSHPNAKAPRNPPQEQSEKKGLPTEYEQRRHCAGVEHDHKKGCYPDDWLSEGPVAFEES